MQMMPLAKMLLQETFPAIQRFALLVESAAIDSGKSVRLTKFVVVLASLLLCFCVGCSRKSSHEPTTIAFLDPEWSHDLTQRNVLPDERLQEFTRQTGIEVKHLPTPEPALDQLAMVRELLKSGDSGPDVLGIDVIWPGTLSQDLIDLKPALAAEISSLDPDLVASFTVNGKVVAVPFHSDIGVLFYRKDLLREYGYGAPPKTWDQVEKMAAKIQQGERAKGQKDFWGFVWPGAAGEALTCNALEWQVSEGGGRIIEADSTISVNNPDAMRSWQRAAGWIGKISPVSVTSFEEWDAVNAFYTGKAAFFRGWARSYFLSAEAEANPEIRDTSKIDTRNIGITSIPGGKSAQAATLGGFGLGVSRSAAHPTEALQLVRFLLHREMEAEAALAHSTGLGQADRYEALAILKESPDSAEMGYARGKVSRPSATVGQAYADVNHAYIEAVHSVISGKSKAPQAASDLEKELIRMTGFKAAPPSQHLNP